MSHVISEFVGVFSPLFPARPRIWGENEICYFASWGSPHFEQWSPKSLGKGMAGAEVAVIGLARQFAKDGYKVTVFCDPGKDAGEYEGVLYMPYNTVNWSDTFNILILWRAPYFPDRHIKAKHLYVDFHDVVSQANWTDSGMSKVEKFFFKSKDHRSMLPDLPDEKAIVIGNGI